MEFFRTVKVEATEKQLQTKLTLDILDQITSELFNLSTPGNRETQIGGIWGEFTLTRAEIKGGVRFALAECPNALAWTVTTGYPPDPEAIIVHLTINRIEKDEEFIEEINEFLDDMTAHLKALFSMERTV